MSGSETPERQDWRAVGTHQQGEYAPAPTAVYSGRFREPTRIVTVLSPVRAGERFAIAGLTAATGADEIAAELVFRDGNRLTIDDRDFPAQ